MAQTESTPTSIYTLCICISNRSTMRATGGVFVWAIESVLLAMFGVGTISIMHMVGGTSSIATDIWAIFVVLCSCVANLVLQTVVAFSSKQPTINEITEGGTPDFAMMYMHKAVAQGHCSAVTLVLLAHIIIMVRSLTDLDWANAYFASAPGLVWVTGTITLAFLTVLWFTSITGSWAATAVGDSNSLFGIIPTTAILCIIFPVLHEIGSNGLMVCSNPMSSTLAVMYANLALATSFTISLLDCVEFDPIHILPKFMRTVGDNMPLFRIYGVIHGICISTTVVMYWIITPGISTPIVMVLLSTNGLVTVANSLSGAKLVARLVPNWILDNLSGPAVDEDDPYPEPSAPDAGSDDFNDPESEPIASEAEFGTNQGSDEIFLRMRGPQRRTARPMPQQPVQAQRRTNWAGLDFLKFNRLGATTPPAAPTPMTISERRIALLRLDSHRGSDLHEM